MQTLALIALVFAASAVAAIDLRELFIGWYSETTPVLTIWKYASLGSQIILCVLVALVAAVRLYARA